MRARVCASADDLCLAFANTLYWRGSAAPTESLNSYPDLLVWCAQAGVLEGSPTERHSMPEPDHGAAATLFNRAIETRETIYRLCHALAAGHSAPARDLRAINRLLANAPARIELATHGATYGWRLPAAKPALEQILAPVLWSTGDLLTGSRLQRLRCCANEQCGWLFLDDSKSGTRRWCMMSACGNRAKARRHYLKTRQSALP